MKRYNWNEINEYAKEHTVKECSEKFGFCMAAWSLAVKKGKVTARSNLKPLENMLVKNSSFKRVSIKRKIIQEGTIPYECEKCHNKGWWEGEKLSLVLDHRNGINNDHRKENLRFLCPNCNSQTPTFSGRNVKRNRS